jgi:hypothetical protein
MEPNKLSDKARAILEAIAKGYTYEQNQNTTLPSLGGAR